MSGTFKNKNAEKWTESSVLKCLSRMMQDVEENAIPYIVRAMINQGLSRKIWAYWREKYADVSRIMERMDIPESTFETHLLEGALGSRHAASVAIFALKNNHHWTDKPQILQTEKAHTENQTPVIILDEHRRILL